MRKYANVEDTNRKAWDEPQWIVAQGPLSALTIPRFMLSRLQKVCRFRNLKLQFSAQTLYQEVCKGQAQQGQRPNGCGVIPEAKGNIA